MQTTDAFLAPFDELTQVELSVAKRADELRRASQDDPADRDFWAEAELEVWTTLRGGVDCGDRPVVVGC